MSKATDRALSIFGALKSALPAAYLPPSGGTKPSTNMVLPFSLVKGTRGYIERVVNQINGSYEHGWFDSCAVMIRRLVETLLIESFEAKGLAGKIKNRSGDYLYLSDLIQAALQETAWTLGRNARTALPRLKDIGDLSAHSRRFNAVREDIDSLLPSLRIASQELLYLAGLK
jgi:hypothetical protein